MKMLTRCFTKVIFVMFCLLVSLYNQYCYALTAQMELVIGCESSPQAIYWHRFDGQSDTQYSLTTIGMKVDEALVDWNGPVSVLAHCIPFLGHSSVDMFPPSKVFPTLTCPKGHGIEVAMIQPNDTNHAKYQYVGTLTVTQDDEIEKSKNITNYDTFIGSPNYDNFRESSITKVLSALI